jgi:RES domain-containing protein
LSSSSGRFDPDLVLVRLELPEGHSSERPALRTLPKGWNAVPPGSASMGFGSDWTREGRSLVLYVPSVLVPEEANALLKPSHREFGVVKMVVARPLGYDPRMYLARTGPGR